MKLVFYDEDVKVWAYLFNFKWIKYRTFCNWLQLRKKVLQTLFGTMCNVGIQALGNKIHWKIVFCIGLKRLYVIGWKASQGCSLLILPLPSLSNIYQRTQKMGPRQNKTRTRFNSDCLGKLYVVLFVPQNPWTFHRHLLICWCCSIYPFPSKGHMYI